MRAQPFDGDVRMLLQNGPVPKRERPEREDPDLKPAAAPVPAGASRQSAPNSQNTPFVPLVQAPATIANFDGLDFANWGAGHPPDTNGDVGPNHYIQTVNTSIGIYDKVSGTRLAAFTFNNFMSQGHFGNLCDTNNFGDPVVLYDTFEDRWFITDFAFALDGSGNVSPQHVYQCMAVSKSGDPVSGGWNYYSLEALGGLDDYPKFGVWPDGIYMSANMFGYAAGAGYQNPRVWALNKAQMYAGAPTVQVVAFDAPSNDFSLLPGNARLQAGTPPAGRPEYFVSTEQYLNALSIYKFHVDWNNVSASTFMGPEAQVAPTCWPNATPANALTTANAADVLAIRAMAQAQYSNISGAESLWVAHTVQRNESATNTTCDATTGGNAAPRWYQLNVTGGTVGANTVQGKTFDPEAANTYFRFMPSVAVDRMGNMAIGYSKSNSSTAPQIKYAGRLFGDPINILSQTEQTLIDGTGSQLGNCGSSTCVRWGDYSAMTLDPDGCTFWYTNEYYVTSGLNDHTRIGSFQLPGCTAIGSGTLQGTVTSSASVAISGATVTLGSRTTTTDSLGHYSFTGLPAGTYPGATASAAGFASMTATSIVVTDAGTTTQNFSLAAFAQSGCFIDTTQADFQLGVATGCDLTSSPGNVTLVNGTGIDQQNTNVNPYGFSFTNTSWAGQTFTPAVSGMLTKVDIELFCYTCVAASPNITISIRATTGATPVPTGGDLATATLAGFNDNAAGGYKTVTFSSPATLTAGTRYAVVFRANAAFPLGILAYTCSCPGGTSTDFNPYANGQRVTSTNSGSAWTADTTVGGRDLNFRIYMQGGFAASGTFVSSLKDANPTTVGGAGWNTLSWTAATPANAGVHFQAAGSNSASGPFTFVGPDSTAGTFFTNGGSLAQFNGFRYLKYKAILSSTDSTVTPTINDVTVCFNNGAASTAATSLAVSAASGTVGGTADLSATLTSSGNAVPGESVSFTLNGASVGSAVTNVSGVASISGVSLAGIGAGSYPAGVGANFAGDTSYSSSSGSAALTVGMADQTINFGALGNKTFGDPDFTVSATATSGLTVTFGASGNCTVTVATVHLTGAGSCTITASQAGDSNYNAASDVPQAFSISPAAKQNQTITFGPLANKTFGDPNFTVSATATSGLTVTFGASGNCTVTGATVHLSGAGSCTITASQAGDATYNAAPDVPQAFGIAKANQTITFGALANKTFGDPDFTVSATATSGLTVTFGASGNCTVTGATVHLTATGLCTITASQGGDSNYNAAPDVPQTFNIVNGAKLDQTITFGPLANKTFGDPDFTVSATASSGLPVTFSASGSCTVTGATVHLTATGSCTITASQAGDSSYNAAPSLPESFAIAPAKVNQTITFKNLPTKKLGSPDFTVSATASSGLPVSFSASGSCTVTGATVHLTAKGTCTITASQGGDSNYNAAASVANAFRVQ
jgi:hypothetical protein